jgi:hypothetical protein
MPAHICTCTDVRHIYAYTRPRLGLGVARTMLQNAYWSLLIADMPNKLSPCPWLRSSRLPNTGCGLQHVLLLVGEVGKLCETQLCWWRHCSHPDNSKHVKGLQEPLHVRCSCVSSQYLVAHHEKRHQWQTRLPLTLRRVVAWRAPLRQTKTRRTTITITSMHALVFATSSIHLGRECI